MTVYFGLRSLQASGSDIGKPSAFMLPSPLSLQLSLPHPLFVFATEVKPHVLNG